MVEYRVMIEEILQSIHPCKFVIVENPLDKEEMNKKLFIEVLESLKKIEDRRDFLEEEIGLDMTTYEDQFMVVIENLFRIAFTDDQVALIKLYLYDLLPDKEWDGKVTIEDSDGTERAVPFKTSEDVWNLIVEVKKNLTK